MLRIVMDGCSHTVRKYESILSTNKTVWFQTQGTYKCFRAEMKETLKGYNNELCYQERPQ